MNISNSELLHYYLLGCAVIGLPMALLSVWFYIWEEGFDDCKWKPVLKLVRNFIHPGSFVLTPDYERGRPRANYRMNYEGPINEFLDDYGDIEAHHVLFYLIFATALWPFRFFISVCVVAIIWIPTICIGFPVYLLYLLIKLLCKSVAWLFRNKTFDRSNRISLRMRR